MKKLVVLLILLAELTTIAPQAEAQTHSTVSTVRAAIQKAYREYEAAAKRHDAIALTALYDDSAMLVPPGRPPIIGHDAILEEERKFVAAPGGLADETFTSVDLRVSGSFAVDVSMFAGHWNVPGKGPLPFRGKNMVVWKRQKDGSWKLYRDMWDEYPNGG